MSCGMPHRFAGGAHFVLEESRSGSMSFSFMRSGRPPTLWWLLMPALGPLCETLSMTSGKACLARGNARLNLRRFLLEDLDEDAPDRLSLLLRIGDALERRQEALGVDGHRRRGRRATLS